jgi:hypothetical protein
MAKIRNLSLFLIILLIGCSWQGQRQYSGGEVVAEWWSMRFCWVSGGVEAYSKTPYWETGAGIKTSKSDPNTVEELEQLMGTILESVIKGK